MFSLLSRDTLPTHTRTLLLFLSLSIGMRKNKIKNEKKWMTSKQDFPYYGIRQKNLSRKRPRVVLLARYKTALFSFYFHLDLASSYIDRKIRCAFHAPRHSCSSCALNIGCDGEGAERLPTLFWYDHFRSVSKEGTAVVCSSVCCLAASWNEESLCYY